MPADGDASRGGQTEGIFILPHLSARAIGGDSPLSTVSAAGLFPPPGIASAKGAKPNMLNDLCVFAMPAFP